MPQLPESNVHGHAEGHEDHVASEGRAGEEWNNWRSDRPLDELRTQWEALAVEPLHLLPIEALIASVRDLSRELLYRTGPELSKTSSTDLVVLAVHLRNGRTLRIPVTHWKYTRSRDGKVTALAWETPATADPLLLFVDVDEIAALTEEPGPDIATAAGSTSW